MSYMIYLSLVITALFLGSAEAQKNKSTVCSQGQVERKSCRLKWKDSTYRFQSKNISLFDGTWRKVEEIPGVKDFAEWEALRLRIFNGRVFFDFKVWEKPKSEAAIQSLRWLIIEVKNTEIELMLDKVIQKRRKDPEVSEKFVLDPPEKHRLFSSQKKVKWTVGPDKGEF